MTTELKRTALYEEHLKLKGKIVPFAGWELPVQYAGVTLEHLACRKNAGLFDVSHMGEFIVSGPGAERFLNFVTTNDLSKVSVGQAQYTLFGNEKGGIIDDLLIYKKSNEDFFIVVNAANVQKNFYHLQSIIDKHGKNFGRFEFGNVSSKYSQIALQGPHSLAILKKITKNKIEELKYYCFLEGHLTTQNIPTLIARTGYTGEDGFELYTPWDSAPNIWTALLEAGEAFGITPCGLAARDTLRAEMKYPLYGNELNESTSPFETGLAWAVKLDKEDFIGKTPMQKIKDKGPSKKLVGFKILEKGIPRKDYKVFDSTGSKEIGSVTTGTHSPSLQYAIGIASLKEEQSKIGTKINIEIRDKKIPAEVCKTPFIEQTSILKSK